MEREILFFAPSQHRAFSTRFLPVKIRVRNFQDISICKILWLPDPKIFAEQNFSGEFFHQQLIRHALRGKDKYILKFLGSKHLLSIFQDIMER